MNVFIFLCCFWKLTFTLGTINSILSSSTCIVTFLHTLALINEFEFDLSKNSPWLPTYARCITYQVLCLFVINNHTLCSYKFRNKLVNKVKAPNPFHLFPPHCTVKHHVPAPWRSETLFVNIHHSHNRHHSHCSLSRQRTRGSFINVDQTLSLSLHAL